MLILIIPGTIWSKIQLYRNTRNNKELQDVHEVISVNSEIEIKIMDEKEAVEEETITDEKEAVEEETITDEKEAVEEETITVEKEAVEEETITDEKEAVEEETITDEKEPEEEMIIIEEELAVEEESICDSENALSIDELIDLGFKEKSLENFQQAAFYFFRALALNPMPDLALCLIMDCYWLLNNLGERDYAITELKIHVKTNISRFNPELQHRFDTWMIKENLNKYFND
ncbi:hypothetical protein [Desulfosporosinus lacus]|uniref:Tetratricopeptide repeat-containing protein n=1 Tax=Desulfosporosinus lacus DSM 15449 TaxID=1121420 RepID=A0A1M5WQL5_9FIRM|nr:hypothetical protein [Desulfosporosinus lacus]SHH89781.1 hypothetical protein SAMN02746098_01733 [Desulfosporosinus lacus DSM 15449]